MHPLDEQNKINRLLMVVAPRGKGHDIQEMLLEKGARTASCLYGKSASNGHILHSLALDTIEKEVVISFVSKRMVPVIFEDLLTKHQFSKPSPGLAFTLPLAASFSILEPDLEKLDAFFEEEAALRISDNGAEKLSENYALAMLITDKGKAEKALHIAQEHGFRGGTIIRAHGTANALKLFLKMPIEPEKDLLLILTPQSRGDELLAHFVNALDLEEANTGVTALIDTLELIGLSANEASEAEER